MRELNGLAPRRNEPIPGTRVVIDLRPLQEPERTPLTAAYLAHLLEAFAADPIPGESFVAVLRALRPDPSDALEAAGLVVAGRRRVPPTARYFRSAGLTIDSFLLRGAEVGTTFRAADLGAAGSIYHTAGGAVPLASGLPVVATLLDLAPWELPNIYAASEAARFGHRLRARILRDATRLIVSSAATGESARRRIHIDPARISVVPLAATEEFMAGAADTDLAAALRSRLGLPDRYLLFAGQYDARKDLGTLFRALAELRAEAPEDVRRSAAAGSRSRSRRAAPLPWPPFVVLAVAAEDAEADTAALVRAAERQRVADLVRVVPGLTPAEVASLEAGARAFVYPAVSEGTGLGVIEALAVGVPAVASRVGPLPELVGPAGILVEPRDPARLAAALRAVWAADHIHEQLATAARRRAEGRRRTWADVARETRLVYAAATGARPDDRVTADGPSVPDGRQE